MSKSFDSASIDGELLRVRELLETHAARAQTTVTETVDGVLAVTVDARLRLTSVNLLDPDINATTREALEQAIVAAVNRAMERVVQSSTQALQGLQESEEWQRMAAELSGKIMAHRT